jgi:hypothetical protein
MLAVVLTLLTLLILICSASLPEDSLATADADA